VDPPGLQASSNHLQVTTRFITNNGFSNGTLIDAGQIVIFTLEIPQENSGDTIPDLVNIRKANWNMAIEIVDLPIKHG